MGTWFGSGSVRLVRRATLLTPSACRTCSGTWPPSWPASIWASNSASSDGRPEGSAIDTCKYNLCNIHNLWDGLLFLEETRHESVNCSSCGETWSFLWKAFYDLHAARNK
uniref:Uncharacterized protein n=1 Tax=Ixodes ricinus TaxID=34613 RepID=A0A6B0UIZ7_IXORI